MCGKSKSSTPAPAPAPVPQAKTTGDTSNMQQKVAATSDTAGTQSFGSELGAGTAGAAMPPGMMGSP